MSTNTPTPEPNEAKPSTEPQGTETPPADPPKPEAPAQDPTDWKAEARKWEQRAKENSDAAAKLAEIEEASKTEAQKQADELDRLRKENEGYKQREQIAGWAKEVSEETDVPAGLLRGSTKEELQAHAEQLKPLIGQQSTEEPRPDAVPTIGKQPVTPPNIPLGEQIAAAEREVASATRGTPEHKAAVAKVMQLKGMQLREAAGK